MPCSFSDWDAFLCRRPDTARRAHLARLDLLGEFADPETPADTWPPMMAAIASPPPLNGT